MLIAATNFAPQIEISHGINIIYNIKFAKKKPNVVRKKSDFWL